MSKFTIPTRFQCDYTWTIQTFAPPYYGGSRDSTEFVAKSPHFLASKSTFEWFLELRTTVSSDPSRGTRLFLEIANKIELEERGPISGKSECSLLNSEGQKVHTNSRYFRFHSKTFYVQFLNFPRDVACLHETDCIHQNQLRIYCQVSYIRETEVNYFSFIEQPDPFKEDFEKLLNDEEFSDVAVYVGDQKFPCHKNILVTRCSVFKAMLSHDMKENNANRIDIRDIDANVFQKVLRYIYTGKVEILETTVLDLLHAADKYDLAILKTMCETELSRTLTVETAVKILSISNTYNLEKLKPEATLFIRTNLKQISGTDAWNDLTSHQDLMKIVLEAFAK